MIETLKFCREDALGELPNPTLRKTCLAKRGHVINTFIHSSMESKTTMLGNEQRMVYKDIKVFANTNHGIGLSKYKMSMS